jgi:hypothetical protein
LCFWLNLSHLTATWCLVWLHPSMSHTVRALSCCHFHFKTDEGQKPSDPALSVPSSDPFGKYCVMWLAFISCGSVGALRVPFDPTVDTNVKKDEVVPAHTAERSGGIAPLILTSTLVGGRWSTLYPQEKNPGTHWIEVWVVPRAGLDVWSEGINIFPLPGFEPRTAQPSLYTDYAIPASYSGYKEHKLLQNSSSCLKICMCGWQYLL